MIYYVCPIHGKVNPLCYLSICATAGAMSVMALKAFDIALKLTFAGANQFIFVSTYFFALVAALGIVTQMNYRNKTLSAFSQSVSACIRMAPGDRSNNITYSVSPTYYVTFTTAVLTASFVLFQGLNITDGMKSVSLLCGFLVTFLGVYLLNYPTNQRGHPEFSDHRLSGMSFEGSAAHSRTSFEVHDSTRPSVESQFGD